MRRDPRAPMSDERRCTTSSRLQGFETSKTRTGLFAPGHSSTLGAGDGVDENGYSVVHPQSTTVGPKVPSLGGRRRTPRELGVRWTDCPYRNSGDLSLYVGGGSGESTESRRGVAAWCSYFLTPTDVRGLPRSVECPRRPPPTSLRVPERKTRDATP